MILLSPKLTHPSKFLSKMEKNHHPNNSLRNFRSKISDFITQILFEPDPSPHKCFELINTTNRAFANMVVEIDYPTTRWGENLTDQYLSFTLNLLGLLNSVNSSLSNLSQAKIPVLHAMTLIKSSPSSAAKYLKKITRKNLKVDFNFDVPVEIEGKPGSETERVVLRALAVSMKVEILAIGFVLSSLCGDAKPYMEIRKRVGEFSDDDDDVMIKEMDSRFCKEVIEIEQGKTDEVKEVNSAMDRLYVDMSNGRYSEGADDLMKKLEVLQNLIRGLEKQANNLFSEVLGTRNKLLDNLRFTGHKYS